MYNPKEDCTKNAVPSGIQYQESDEPSFKRYKEQEKITQKPKPKQQEKQNLNEGLQISISPDNKGFKTLEKVGYTSCSGIGKSSVRMKEPVSKPIKVYASGLGRGKHTKVLNKEETESKALRMQACENEYLKSRSKILTDICIRKDICNAQRMCEELDMQKGIEYPQHSYHWQKRTIKDLDKKNKIKLKAANNKHGDEDDDDNVHDVEDSSSSDCEDYKEPNELLESIITYMRNTYSYCLYCDDFIGNGLECPGFFRIHHE